jgi:hypothetical protein
MGDIADEHVDRMIFGKHPVYGPPLQCRHCGAGGLYWQKVNGQQVIYERATISRHRCPPKDVTSEFEVRP